MSIPKKSYFRSYTKVQIFLLSLMLYARNAIYLKEVHSTNSYALDLLSKSNPIEGTVIKTYHQRAGKGQIGRSWYGGEGKNLAMSMILYPHFLAAQQLFYLSMMTALAIRDVFHIDYGVEDLTIKWPNDIYYQNKKLAGILIQQSLKGDRAQFAILGIGVNVNEKDFPADLPNPISVAQILGREISLEKVEKAISERLWYYYTQLYEGKIGLIRRAYLASMYARGEIVVYYDRKGNELRGELVGIDDQGQLVLSIHQELCRFSAGEISTQVDFV